jgi:hypothetical protein
VLILDVAVTNRSTGSSPPSTTSAGHRSARPPPSTASSAPRRWRPGVSRRLPPPSRSGRAGLFVTVTQNPDRRFHGERTIYCEGDTPFAETFQGTSFTMEESALLDARLCTSRGPEDIHEDCVSVTRTLLIQPK